VRGPAEFLIALALALLLLRTFLTEAYIVPTGSMAPTLLGLHRDLACPACGAQFAVGLDEAASTPDPLCPNCGHRGFPPDSGNLAAGDRLLVHKNLFQLRPPRRWETAVFLAAEQPGQPFVKRIVGLPGERLQIRDGDVVVDGRVATKSLAEQRALRVLVHDFDHRDRDAETLEPRWAPAPGQPASPWRVREGRLLHHDRSDDLHWIAYHHRQPDWVAPGPIRDHLAYNGPHHGGDYRVDDLMLEADLRIQPGATLVAVRFDVHGHEVIARLPVDDAGPPTVTIDGREAPVTPTGVPLRSCPTPRSRPVRLEASTFDRALLVALDGRPAFEPVPLPEPTGPPRFVASPISLGAGRGTIEASRLRVHRDVYYTPTILGAPQRGFAVAEPYTLGPDEFFVLGDNSPVSNDSRFWARGPVVRRDDLVGKPFLVHLPSQVVPVRVFGWTVSWVPDPREIRYIR
jgi:signal peptidase I